MGKAKTSDSIFTCQFESINWIVSVADRQVRGLQREILPENAHLDTFSTEKYREIQKEKKNNTCFDSNNLVKIWDKKTILTTDKRKCINLFLDRWGGFKIPSTKCVINEILGSVEDLI